MEKLLNQLLEKAKGNKKELILLKNVAVKCQQYELASKLRELETQMFPYSDEEKVARQLAKEVKLALGMVDLNVPEHMSWLIAETLKRHSILKGEFTIKDASEILARMNELFDEIP